MRYVPEPDDIILFNDETREAEAVRCQFCGAEQISGGPIEIDDSYAVQQCECDVCNAAFTDRYLIVEREFKEVPYG